MTNAHSGSVYSVAFSPDSTMIVSASECVYDRTIKIWDVATPRPFNASEWEEVDISGMEKDKSGRVEIEGVGRVRSNYWKNTVTGETRAKYSTASELSPLEPIEFWDAGETCCLKCVRPSLSCLLSTSQARWSSRRRQ